MKKTILVHARQTFTSTSAGVKIQYAHDVALCDILGQAKTMLVQLYGHRITGTNTKTTVEVWHTCLPSGRPVEVGKQLGSTITLNPTTLRPAIQTINGPMAGRVELVIGIEDSTAAAQQEYDVEVWATLILEE